jgi:prophage antirepressor-like protein
MKELAIQSSTSPRTNQTAAPSGDSSPVTSFTFENIVVRTAVIDGIVYFIARDLAAALGFANGRQAVRSHVSKKDYMPVQNLDAPTVGGSPFLLAVNESGLFSLILGSKNPKAQAFKDWVTSEVLPAIRRSGRYELSGRRQALLGYVVKALRGRGVSKQKQLNRVIGHRDGSVSLRVGGHWIRRVSPAVATQFSFAHSLREGVALNAIQPGQRALVQ